MFDWLKKNTNNFGRGPARPGTLEYAEQAEERRLAKIEKMTNPSLSEEGMRQVCDMYFNAWVVRSRPLEGAESAEYANQLMSFQHVKNKTLADEIQLMDGAEAALNQLCLKVASCRNDPSAFRDAFDELFLYTCKISRYKALQEAINS